jgi:hypothetical protein
MKIMRFPITEDFVATRAHYIKPNKYFQLIPRRGIERGDTRFSIAHLVFFLKVFMNLLRSVDIIPLRGSEDNCNSSKIINLHNMSYYSLQQSRLEHKKKGLPNAFEQPLS